FVRVKMRRRVPRVVIRIERLARVPHGEGQVQEFAHDVTDGDGRLVGMLGAHARVERLASRVEGRGAQGRHPEGAGRQVVAATTDDVGVRRRGIAVAIDAAGYFDRQRAKIGHQLARGAYRVNVADEGGEDAGGDLAEALDGIEVIRLGQPAIGRDQQAFQAFLPGGAVAHL